MSRLALIAWSFLPGLLWLAFVYRRDRHAPEPLRLMLQVYAAGMLMSLVAGLVNTLGTRFFPLTGAGIWSTALGCFLVVGPGEELFKLAALRFAQRHDEFDEPLDGLVYSGAAALGFASLENVQYAVEAGAGVIWLRAITAVPAHFLFAGLYGYAVGARLGHVGSAWSVVWAWLAAAFLHGFYDFALFGGRELGKPWLSLVAMAVLIALAFVHRSELARLRRMGFAMLAASERFCAACRRPLAPDSRFCPACGAGATSGGDTGVCLACGAVTARGSFCNHCGAPT